MRINAELTERELQVAELLACGAARKEAADRLCVSASTIRKHAENIFAKLQIQKITELSVWWFCKHCGVSWNLDPLKRFVTVLLVCVCVSHDVMAGTTNVRARRAGRGRRNETEYVINL